MLHQNPFNNLTVTVAEADGLTVTENVDGLGLAAATASQLE